MTQATNDYFGFVPKLYGITFKSFASVQLPLNEKRMSKLIPTEAAVEAITKINGVAISKIEERAQPGKDSEVGFLAKGESLKTVMVKDFQTVKAMGMTHIEIADLLTKVRDFNYKMYPTRDNYLDNGPPRGSPISIEAQVKFSFPYQGNTFNCRLVRIQTQKPQTSEEDDRLFDEWNKTGNSKPFYDNIKREGEIEFNKECEFLNAQAEPNEQILMLGFPNVTIYGGGQTDLFRANPNDYNPSWNANYTITNSRTKKDLYIAEGIIPYIMYFGFYEGNTRYRLDPKHIVSVFTGQSL